ncbi:unnamed protein product [Arctia plantaginis]|uniref:Uncharacterized protein n=1 Tax=Arctia plantaginis TaxID=874455 RepID=A0A8S0ZN95_ARCPL|nr:unnamed protein product [Arctia plantaginis]
MNTFYQFQLLLLWCVYSWSGESAVLDPSLYLSPIPPLTDRTDSIAPAALWSRSAIKLMPGSSASSSQVVDERSQIQKRKPNPVEKAKLFWPSLRPSHYSVGTGNIQVPLTFSLSGLYGKYAPGAVGTGIIGSSYGTISDIGGTAISTLAGNGYGSYRTYPGLRIYGRENGPTWSGWSNGKWGHYGKG